MWRQLAGTYVPYFRPALALSSVFISTHGHSCSLPSSPHLTFLNPSLIFKQVEVLALTLAFHSTSREADQDISLFIPT